MKERSKRTPRRVVRRIEKKRARKAEKRALEGGPVRTVGGESWGLPTRAQPPLLDDSPVGYKKRRSKKRDRSCPAREGSRRHHYIKEEREVRDPSTGEKYRPRYKLCGYCGKEVRGYRRWGRLRW